MLAKCQGSMLFTYKCVYVYIKIVAQMNTLIRFEMEPMTISNYKQEHHRCNALKVAVKEI